MFHGLHVQNLIVDGGELDRCQELNAGRLSLIRSVLLLFDHQMRSAGQSLISREKRPTGCTPQQAQSFVPRISPGFSVGIQKLATLRLRPPFTKRVFEVTYFGSKSCAYGPKP